MTNPTYRIGSFLVRLEEDSSEVSVSFEGPHNTLVYFLPTVVRFRAVLKTTESTEPNGVHWSFGSLYVIAYETDEGLSIDVYDGNTLLDSTYFFPSDFDIEVDDE